MHSLLENQRLLIKVSMCKRLLQTSSKALRLPLRSMRKSTTSSSLRYLSHYIKMRDNMRINLKYIKDYLFHFVVGHAERKTRQYLIFFLRFIFNIIMPLAPKSICNRFAETKGSLHIKRAIHVRPLLPGKACRPSLRIMFLFLTSNVRVIR